MAVQFGTFAPQGWRLDLIEIADPVEKYEAMTAVAQAADAIPVYDSVWVYDHFHTVPRIEHEAVFEAWTITAALARDTKRVKVGQMVTCLGYRNPALAAKIASTVDVLSHGRLYYGCRLVRARVEGLRLRLPRDARPHAGLPRGHPDLGEDVD
jgi:alkanesulfonate monooxygenase SsuD/methylene tetrahydromethanopterin reductase-like flavin-dependent oxidoreductase (luciferase family)